MKDLISSAVLLALIALWHVVLVFQEIIHLLSCKHGNKTANWPADQNPTPERK